MSQSPPAKPPAKPAAPGAPAAPTGPREDRLEQRGANPFASGKNRPEFHPTPLKKPPSANNTGEMSRPSPAPTRPPASARSGQPSNSTSGERPGFLMPGAGAKPATPTMPKSAEAKSAEARSTTKPGTMPAAPGAKPAPAKPAAPAAPPRAPAKPSGIITTNDKMQYQGKLPVFVGSAADGNPMVDAEDSSFAFDPVGKRIQLVCKVASIMMKAAALHLGLPPLDRGPRRFTLVANMKQDVVAAHAQKLFDGNLEIRLTAQQDGRPVLLDLTLYEGFSVTPDG